MGMFGLLKLKKNGKNCWLKLFKMYSLHGMSRDAWKQYSDDGYRHYKVLFPGFKYNMMDLQAAIGIHQFKHVNGWLKRRNEIWQCYNEAFAELPVGMPAPDEPDTVHARHFCTLMIDEKNCGVTRYHFIQRMCKLNIGMGVPYISVHLHPYYSIEKILDLEENSSLMQAGLVTGRFLCHFPPS